MSIASLIVLIAATGIIRPGDHVVLVGDSEAYLLAHEFPALAARDGVRFTAHPRPGSSVITWASASAWASTRADHPNVLLISLGANDACMGAGVVANEGPHLTRLLAHAANTGAREIVWLGPPSIGSATILPQASAGLSAFATMIRATSTRYLDARTIAISMWPDLLHCSRPQFYGDNKANGCSTWARWVWDDLSRT